LKGSIIRLCSIYGDIGKGLINLIKNKIKNNEEININAEFDRQYLYVKDLCKLFEDILKEGYPQLIYNIQGEKVNSKEIYLFLQKRGLKISFGETKKTSYLCKGLEIKSEMNVNKFLLA